MRSNTRNTNLFFSPLSLLWLIFTVFLATETTVYSFGPIRQPVGNAAAIQAPVASSSPAVSPAILQARRATAGQRSDLAVMWNNQRGVPVVVKGLDILREQSAAQQQGLGVAAPLDFRQKAVNVMGALAGLYGVEDASREFAPGTVETSKSGYRHVRMNQVYHGLPVVGAQLIVHFDAQGAARVVNGVYQPVSGVVITPSLSVAEATAIGVADQAALGNPVGAVTEAPALVIYARDTVPTLAYQFTISYGNAKGAVGQWRYWVNALTGSILLRYNDLKSIGAPTPATGAPSVITGGILMEEGGGTNSVTGWRENSGAHYLWSFANTWYIYDANLGDYAWRSTNNWYNSDRTEMSAGRNVEATAVYYRMIHGRNSIDDAGMMARADVHNTGDVNAYWDGTKLILFDELPCALDVCGHEFTHGVTQYTADLVYYSESGALNESYSDIFGTLIEFYLQPDGRALYPGSSPGMADWLMGEDTAPAVGIIRDMRNPSRKGDPSRYKGSNWYTGSGDNAGVHVNSGVQNFFFYLLCEGGTGNNDGLHYSFPGIGIPAGGHVAYLALTKYSGPDTDFAASREAWISAAQETDASGLTTNTVYPVMAAWAAAGVGFANAPLVNPSIVHVFEGGTTNIGVTLAVQPFTNVTVTVSQLGGSSNLVIVGTSNLTFTTSDWNVPQPLTVGALSDADMTNDVATFILTSESSGVGSMTFTAIQMDLGDTLPPQCVITGSVNPDRSIIALDFEFDESVAGFTESDISITDNVVGGITFLDFTDVTGLGRHYRARYTSASTIGALQVTVPAGSLTDLSGNLNPNEQYQTIYTIPWVQADFADSFDGSATTWTRSTNVYDAITSDVWRWGPPAYDTNLWHGPAAAYSASNCWGVMSGPFDRRFDGWVRSPVIPVEANPVLSFKLWFQASNSVGYVEVNGGYGWVTVANYHAADPSWQPQTIELDNAEFGSRSIQIRFRAIGDDCAIYVDDVRVESQRAPSVYMVAASPGNGDAGTTVPVAFTVYNSTTSTLSGVTGTVSCPDEGVSIGAGSPVSYGSIPAGGVVSGSAVSVQLASPGYPFWVTPVVLLQHQALVGGLAAGADVFPFTVNGLTLTPATNSLLVRTGTGSAVTNWLGARLRGNGGADSCLFQVIYAGTNGVADVPTENGRTTGDDHILFGSVSGDSYGRFGEGMGGAVNLGTFAKLFSHNLGSNALVYVRAWDAASFAGAAAYGDSALLAITRTASQTNSYGSWGVNRPAPGSFSRDSNGDSIPDGWCVLHGLDPLDPIAPLGCKVLESKAITDFLKPNRVAVSSNFVFVADTENNRVQVWDRALSTRMSVFGSPTPTEFHNPAGIAVTRDGTRLAVADTLNNRIRLFTVTPLTGTLVPVLAFGATGTNTTQFNNPMAVAFGATGDIYVADSKAVGLGNNRVQVFSGSGEFLRTFGAAGTGDGQFGRLLGIGIGPDGELYAADGPNNRMQTFAAGTTFDWKYGASGSSAGQFNWVWDAQPGVGGLLYVTDLNNNRIQILNTQPTRSVAGMITNAGSLGNFSLPRSAAPAPDGNVLYVADTYNSRIIRLRLTLDADGDGMDDVWEVLHGLDPTVNDALADADGDGVSNIGEYRAGTDPQVLTGGINLKIMQLSVAPAILGWQAVSGNIYRVQSATSLILPDWVDGEMVSAPTTGWLSFSNSFVNTNQLKYLRVQWINAP